MRAQLLSPYRLAADSKPISDIEGKYVRECEGTSHTICERYRRLCCRTCRLPVHSLAMRRRSFSRRIGLNEAFRRYHAKQANPQRARSGSITAIAGDRSLVLIPKLANNVMRYTDRLSRFEHNLTDTSLVRSNVNGEGVQRAGISRRRSGARSYPESTGPLAVQEQI